MKSKFFILMFFLGCILVHAQVQPNLSGIWEGTSTFLNSQSQLRYELTQDGGSVSGFFSAKDLVSKDSIKATIAGELEGSKVVLEGVDVIYRTGKACLSKVELTYVIDAGKEVLTGKWKGDMRLNTCPPFVSGPITLRREMSSPAASTLQSEIAGKETIADDDRAGQALVNELGKRRYHALIIGIDQYEDDEISDLDHPVNDAKALREVLIDHYSFNPEYLIFLENPSRGQIISTLDRLAGEVTEKENLLIFYAGHGIWNEQLKQGYWLPADAAVNSKAYWLSNSTLRDYVRGIPSKHTLLVSDACFSGGIFKQRAIMGNSKALLEMYKLPSRKAMTSGTLRTVPDESVFMKYLLKTLSTNQAPLLSADQLFRGFKMTVINNSPNGQVPQYGPITQAGDEGGDFIFLKKGE